MVQVRTKAEVEKHPCSELPFPLYAEAGASLRPIVWLMVADARRADDAMT
jgi:hypothetical protein